MITSIFCTILIAFSSYTTEGIVGKWSYETSQGSITVEFKADNTYTVDLGADGQIDITGEYSMNGNQVTVQDKTGENRCDEKGVYTVNVEANVLKLTKVKDDCPGRGDDTEMMMTRL